MKDVKQKEEHHPLHYCERTFRALYSPRYWALCFAIAISIVALMLVVGIVIFHFGDLIPAPISVWSVVLGGLVLIVLLYWLLRRLRHLERELDVKVKEAHNPLYYTEKFFRELYSPREWAKAIAIAISMAAAVIVGWVVIRLSMGEILVDDLVWVVVWAVIVVGGLCLSVFCYKLLRRTRRLVREVTTQPVNEHVPAQAEDI